MAVTIIDVERDAPIRFAQIPLSLFNGYLTESFLTHMTSNSYQIGVKRNNYYIMRTDALITFQINDIQTSIISKLINWAQFKGYTYLMFLKK